MQPIALGSSYSTLLGCGYHFLSTVSGKRFATMAAIRRHVEYSVLTHGDGVQPYTPPKMGFSENGLPPKIWSDWWPTSEKYEWVTVGMITIWKVIKAMFHSMIDYDNPLYPIKNTIISHTLWKIIKFHGSSHHQPVIVENQKCQIHPTSVPAWSHENPKKTVVNWHINGPSSMIFHSFISLLKGVPKKNINYRWFSHWNLHLKVYVHPKNRQLAMDQYLLIPFLMGWTSIYQLFWCELQGYYWFWHTANFHTTNIEKSPKSSASPGANSPNVAELLRSRPPRGATSKDSDVRVHTMPWLLGNTFPIHTIHYIYIYIYNVYC